MGSFSWLYADKIKKGAGTTLGARVNIRYGAPYKVLIPKEFGGGCVIDHYYDDYGMLNYKDENGIHICDLYEILAAWNSPKFKGDNRRLPEESKLTDYNRGIGIEIGCYDCQIDALKYPLKLVSVKYRGTYEDLDSRSYNDPNQGCGNYLYKEYLKDH